MDSFIVLNMILVIIVVVILMAIAFFAIGCFIGYKWEDRKILKRNQGERITKYEESEQEKKAKKDWKNFLEYDGSATDGVDI